MIHIHFNPLQSGYIQIGQYQPPWGYIGIVAADALVLKHQAISIHNTDLLHEADRYPE